MLLTLIASTALSRDITAEVYGFTDEPSTKIALGFAGGDPCDADAEVQFLMDAADLLDWYEGFGFEQRLWSNASSDTFDEASFRDEVLAAAAELAAAPPSEGGGYPELVIVYEGHGTEFGLQTAAPGVDPLVADLDWLDLIQTLQQIPPGIVVTLILDACRSGAFTTEILGADTDPPGGLTGLTVITSTNATDSVSAGLGWTDSATEDFLEPYADGRQGTVCERFADMDAEGCGAPTLWQAGVLPANW